MAHNNQKWRSTWTRWDNISNHLRAMSSDTGPTLRIDMHMSHEGTPKIFAGVTDVPPPRSVSPGMGPTLNKVGTSMVPTGEGSGRMAVDRSFVVTRHLEMEPTGLLLSSDFSQISIHTDGISIIDLTRVLFGSSSCSSALSSVNCGKATVLFKTHGFAVPEYSKFSASGGAFNFALYYCFAMEAPRGLTVMASEPFGPSPNCTNKDAADAGIGESTPTNTNVDTNVDVGEFTSYRHTPSADYDDGEIEDEPEI
ncbi:hypothetical protein Cgig2_006371 [Carnegiea gigantea]|uniref:Uncharacterized protein n=1 Tax=Carnegiea gigantea TaxID=171969 RepID=A0A9Q1K3N3_9CARY|nr:hypothetical protein Cgig2_006371 [Carnegiea gigantea]